MYLTLRTTWLRYPILVRYWGAVHSWNKGPSLKHEFWLVGNHGDTSLSPLPAIGAYVGIFLRFGWRKILKISIKAFLPNFKYNCVYSHIYMYIYTHTYIYVLRLVSYGFSSSHVWMWELAYKERQELKNQCFWSMVLQKTLDSPLDCREIKPVNPKGNQSWIFTGRTDVEAETPILWPPDVKNWLIGKDPDAGKDWRREEKETTEDEMVGWHHQLHRHEFE